MAFIHRFGSSLNEHVHFHCCVIDGVFQPIADTDDEENVVFHAAWGLDAVAIADVQAVVRQRILRTFVRRGLIDKDDATEMRAWAHDGGFSSRWMARYASPSLLWCARAQCTAALCGDGASPCRRSASADLCGD